MINIYNYHIITSLPLRKAIKNIQSIFLICNLASFQDALAIKDI
jgi:hypothetical protein